MEVTAIIAEIDSQIAKLQQARALLAGTPAAAPKARRGRPKGSKNATGTVKVAPKKTAKKAGKRRLSPEGRKAIAEAMKRRWAERRKELGK